MAEVRWTQDAEEALDALLATRFSEDDEDARDRRRARVIRSSLVLEANPELGEEAERRGSVAYRVYIVPDAEIAPERTTPPRLRRGRFQLVYRVARAGDVGAPADLDVVFIVWMHDRRSGADRLPLRHPG